MPGWRKAVALIVLCGAGPGSTLPGAAGLHTAATASRTPASSLAGFGLWFLRPGLPYYRFLFVCLAVLGEYEGALAPSFAREALGEKLLIHVRPLLAERGG